ncbi:hypothetical protein EDB19DRAFT_490839 [Suillus lakei]|nr:hypothetical protein EDB19DRAFT_490839 [Suillus lakei]
MEEAPTYNLLILPSLLFLNSSMSFSSLLHSSLLIYFNTELDDIDYQTLKRTDNDDLQDLLHLLLGCLCPLDKQRNESLLRSRRSRRCCLNSITSSRTWRTLFVSRRRGYPTR